MIIIRFKAVSRDTVLMMYINRGDVSKSELLASWTSTGHGFLKSILLFPTSLAFLDKKMLKAWKWYQHCLSSHPVKTQIVSSGTLWGIGDIGAQYITHSTATSLLPKSVTSLRIGFLSIFYNWYFLFLICHLGIYLWIVFFSQLCQLCLWILKILRHQFDDLWMSFLLLSWCLLLSVLVLWRQLLYYCGLDWPLACYLFQECG